MRKGEEGHRIVKLIGAFKLIKGILLLSLAVGAFRFLNRDIQSTLVNLTERLHVDPQGKYAQVFLARVLHLSPKLPLIAIGIASYGLLFCTESIGLLMEKRWGEYLTVISTASFIPLEIYEILKHNSPIKICVTVLNLAIVVYLIVRLKRDKNPKDRVSNRFLRRGVKA
jgi:uncharacterized membrane protein (DUF2068 family)